VLNFPVWRALAGVLTETICCQRAGEKFEPEMRSSLETGALLGGALSRYLRSYGGACLWRAYEKDVMEKVGEAQCFLWDLIWNNSGECLIQTRSAEAPTATRAVRNIHPLRYWYFRIAAFTYAISDKIKLSDSWWSFSESAAGPSRTADTASRIRPHSMPVWKRRYSGGFISDALRRSLIVGENYPTQAKRRLEWGNPVRGRE